MHDETFLVQKAEPATKDDLYIADDLRDTLEANKEKCVGMAANMIGVNKRIIIFEDAKKYFVMFNPEIIKKRDVIETEEKPEDTYKETKRCDIYINWFESCDEAMEFIEGCKVA